MNTISEESVTKVDPSSAVGNFTVEIPMDTAKVMEFLVPVGEDPGKIKEILVLLGKALHNAEHYLERCAFTITASGNLKPDIRYHELPDRILIVDMADMATVKSLAVLDEQIVARQKSGMDTSLFQPWNITGRIKGGEEKDNLVLNYTCTFHLLSRKTLWDETSGKK